MKLSSRKLRDPINAFQIEQVLEDLRRILRGMQFYSGKGTPEGVVGAPIGAIYSRIDGGTSTTLYVKESNDKGVTGWVAK